MFVYAWWDVVVAGDEERGKRQAAEVMNKLYEKNNKTEKSTSAHTMTGHKLRYEHAYVLHCTYSLARAHVCYQWIYQMNLSESKQLINTLVH